MAAAIVARHSAGLVIQQRASSGFSNGFRNFAGPFNEKARSWANSVKMPTCTGAFRKVTGKTFTANRFLLKRIFRASRTVKK